jgi:hypothetical protein
MGYFKNRIIANQVELGDRIPAPRSAKSHVAYQHGITSRRWLRAIEREHRDHHRGVALAVGFVALGIGMLLGFVWAVIA